MSKRQKVTFDELTKRERLVLCAVAEAVTRKDKYVSVYIGKKTADVSIHPWKPERTGRWVEQPGQPRHYRCSECGWPHTTPYKYCPDCGARMEGNDAAKAGKR